MLEENKLYEQIQQIESYENLKDLLTKYPYKVNYIAEILKKAAISDLEEFVFQFLEKADWGSLRKEGFFIEKEGFFLDENSEFFLYKMYERRGGKNGYFSLKGNRKTNYKYLIFSSIHKSAYECVSVDGDIYPVERIYFKNTERSTAFVPDIFQDLCFHKNYKKISPIGGQYKDIDSLLVFDKSYVNTIDVLNFVFNKAEYYHQIDRVYAWLIKNDWNKVGVVLNNLDAEVFYSHQYEERFLVVLKSRNIRRVIPTCFFEHILYAGEFDKKISPNITPIID